MDSDGRVFALECMSTDTIADLKKKVCALKKELPIQDQRHVFRGFQMGDTMRLADSNIKEGSTLHLVIGMIGGGAGPYVIILV
ncbi:Ubiquitin-like protein [Carex littledalei]|uniref:Ubiquitin-like protein n=1 Tax=Carex littledalei TaxID=544730 RepID=A0A833QGE7_9POAL|nr:Ubiquitin-like protein [Carex littledalei]